MTNEINETTQDLIIENNQYQDLLDFFEYQYKNSEEILETLRQSTQKVQEMRDRRALK